MIVRSFLSHSLLLVAFFTLLVTRGHAQDGSMHGAVEAVSGETVTVHLKEGYRVDSGTKGIVYGTKMTLGEETTVEQGQIRAESAQERMVTASLAESDGISVGQVVRFEEVQSVGTLKVSVQPRSAEVYIDGVSISSGRFEKTIETGTHQVKAESERCSPVSKSLRIDRATMNRVQFQLNCETGTLAVETAPNDATVYLGDKRLGTGDLEEIVIAGKHSVTVNAEHYRSETKEVRLEEGQRKEVRFSLDPLPGRLTLTTQPSSASVKLRGESEKRYEEVGRTPIKQHEIPSGEYEIVVEKKGHSKINKKIEIKPGKFINESIPLVELATLLIHANPHNAKVFLDGSKVGTGSVEEKVAPGVHSIEVKKGGFRNKKDIDIEVERGG